MNMLRFKTIVFITVFLLVSLVLKAQYQPKTIVFKLRKDLAAEQSVLQQIDAITQEYGSIIYALFPNHTAPLEATNAYGDSLVDLSRWYQLEYQANVPEAFLVNKLKATSWFDYVERRPQNALFYVPNDSLLSHQWYLQTIKAFDAWNVEQGDTNVVVGITDTGIDRLQEDLIDGIKYNYQDTVDGIDNDNDGFVDNFCGWDIGNNDNNVQWGPTGHGTFVSGFVSAVPDNGRGIAGVGFHTKILPVKIDNPDGILVHDYEGIVYAADHNCAVINCSWGGPVFTHFGQDVVDYATNNRNTLIVAACGNSNNDTWMYPASYDNVLSVAATDSLDVRWTQSSYGSRVDLCAPGTFVYSTWVSNIYFSSHGTSFSAPMVAAAAALVKAHYPWMTAQQLGEQVRVNTDFIDTVGTNAATKDLMGSGRLNVVKSLTDSLSPAIRMRTKRIVLNSTEDTLSISGEFINYLFPSSSALKATLSTNSTYLQLMDSVFQLGAMAMGDTKNNYNQQFVLKVLPNLPLNFTADLKITYSDTAYHDFEFVRVVLKREYRNLDTNEIELTISGKGRIGFNDDAMNEGLGMIYKGGRNILSFGGLMLASSSSKVSDNVYGEQGFDHDFEAMIPVADLVSGPGDQSFYSEFNDDGASFLKQYLNVKQYSYAFNQPGARKYAVLEYHIFNQGSQPLNGFYAGLYADFDIGLSAENKAAYDSTLNLAYTWQVNGSKYAGISVLQGQQPNCFNIDNNGDNGSVNIYDGFYSFEKYRTLTQSRDSAAWTAQGGDVSSVVSAGPYSIAPGDSIVVAFAVVAGDHLYDIRQNALAAYNKYHNTASIGEALSTDNSCFLAVMPNPADGQTEIIFSIDKRGKLQLDLYDNYGRLMEQIAHQEFSAGKHRIIFNTKNYAPGIYYLKLHTDRQTKSIKLLINR
jgi:hypothetical protein